jgi:ABC-type polysaccharide/polyol phosphate export permease
LRVTTQSTASLRRRTAILWSIYRLDLSSRRRHHLLGLVWVVTPILFAIALAIVGRGGRFIPSESMQGLPYALYVLVGLFVWQSFADGLLVPLRQVEAYRTHLANGQMAPEAAIATGLFDLSSAIAVRVVITASVAMLFALPGSWHLTLLLAPFLAASGLGLALGIGLCLPGLLARDIGRGMNLLLALTIVASPIFYRAEPWGWATLNPLAGWIGDARLLVLGHGVSALDYAVAVVAVGAALAASLLWLRRGRHPFLDKIA